MFFLRQFQCLTNEVCHKSIAVTATKVMSKENSGGAHKLKVNSMENGIEKGSKF